MDHGYEKKMNGDGLREQDANVTLNTRNWLLIHFSRFREFIWHSCA